jgi:hypothetical protein
MVRIISGGLGELVRPCVDDGITIDVLDTCHDALFEFVFRGHSDVAQDRAGELGEEAFDEVEPGAVLGREGELEAAGRLGSEPSSRFSGDVRGMIVEDQLDRGTRRISRIEKLEEPTRMKEHKANRRPLPFLCGTLVARAASSATC